MRKNSKDGYELRKIDGTRSGIFATRLFNTGDIVMVGKIGRLLNKNQSHAAQIGEKEFIYHAGLLHMVNHSCDPNCGLKVNETGAYDFVAMRNLCANDEITIDYAMQNYNNDFLPEECECGSEKCRGKITGWKDLTDEKKTEYKDFVVPYMTQMETAGNAVKSSDV